MEMEMTKGQTKVIFRAPAQVKETNIRAEATNRTNWNKEWGEPLSRPVCKAEPHRDYGCWRIQKKMGVEIAGVACSCHVPNGNQSSECNVDSLSGLLSDRNESLLPICTAFPCIEMNGMKQHNGSTVYVNNYVKHINGII